MMSASGSDSLILGYLGYVEIPNHGFVGGYLLVNERARPIEFHCTAPVCPSRTQEILYGDTFRPALLCDHIGEALFAKSNRRPSLLLTNEPDALGLRETIAVPLGLLVHAQDLVGSPKLNGNEWFEHLSCFVTHAPGFEQDQESIARTLRAIESSWDLSEPLDRIRSAVNEAQRAAA